MFSPRKRNQRFQSALTDTVLVETFGERRKNCSLNAFVEAHSFLEELQELIIEKFYFAY